MCEKCSVYMLDVQGFKESLREQRFNFELKKGQYFDASINSARNVITISKNGIDIVHVMAGEAKGAFRKRRNLKAVIKSIGEDVVSFQIIRWADLHRHSGFSFLDGMSHIRDIVAKTEYVGALTDHGAMHGVLEYYKQMKKAGKQPILGFEAYVETHNKKKEGNHLWLVAKNLTGFKNLMKLTSESYGNFYRKPHVSFDMLRKYSDGIISSTSCMSSEISTLLLKNDYKTAKKVAEMYIDIFGKENYYVEIQRHGIEGEEWLNKHLMRLAKELDLKIIGTTDSHYTNKEDKDAHEILLAIGTGKKMTDDDRMTFDGTGYHLHSPEEVEDLFEDIPEALDGTLEIAEKCSGFELELNKVHMPHFKVPAPFKSELEYLKHLAWKGFDERFKGTEKYHNPEYRERLEFELSVIEGMGFPGYFLIVWDFVNFAKRNYHLTDERTAQEWKTFIKQNGMNPEPILVGPGRGSVVGALTAYVLNISDLDPIPLGLLFERFLNPDRVSMPDIDMDFQDDRREEVINYVRWKYGEEAVAKIITYGTLSARSVVRDVTRVLDYPYSVGDKIAKTIPAEPKMTIQKAFDKSPEFKKLYENDADAKKIIDTARKLEGLPRNRSIHACFDADTLVTTSKGLKRIADIQVGDEVLTHNRRYKKVARTMVTHTKEVYTLKTTASFPIEVTGNHPFYVRERKRKRLRKYKDGVDSSVKTFGEPEWKPVSELEVGKHYIGIPINQESIIPVRENIDLPFNSKDFWWIVGRYIGDGWTECHERKSLNGTWNENRVIICCTKVDESEKDKISYRLDKAGFEYRVEEVNTAYKIHIKNKDLYSYLQEFGKYAHEKRLNGDVLNLPTELLSAFLDGCMSADGNYFQNIARCSFKTASKELAIGLMQVVNKVYKRQTNLVEIPEKVEYIEGRKVHSKKKYQIFFTKDTRKKEQSFYEEGYIWTRLSKLEKREESKDMYNLTVYDDSSYVVHGLSVHNCGVLIAPSAISNYIPELLMENEELEINERTAQLNMSECEEMGILKMDFLGLRTMTVIAKTLEAVNKKRIQNGEKPLHYLDIPLNDPKVYKDISKGESYGVFQLESPGMRSFMKELFADAEQVKEGTMELFERLVAGVSLYRPGPLDYIPEYLKNMRNPDYIQYDHPKLEPILKDTYGVIVYQEQCMAIVRVLADFTKGEADNVRKAFAKKKEEMIQPLGEKFMKGCIANGISKEIAERIWGKMKKFGQYAFNKSHAGAYGTLSAITAWLKHYYPVEFMTAVLNSYITKSDKLKIFLSVVKKMGIQILPPDVNRSGQMFTVDEGRIRFGLQGIKGLGKASENIILERETKGEFKSIQDLVERMAISAKIDKKIMEAMIYSGAVDSFEGTRNAKLFVLEEMLKYASEVKKDLINNDAQMDLFSWAEEVNIDIGMDVEDLKRKVPTPNIDEMPKKVKLEKEKEYAGFYVTEHPLDDYVEYFASEGVYEIGFLTDHGEEEEGVEGLGQSYDYDGEKIKIAGIIKDMRIFYTKKDNKPIYIFQVEDKTGEMKAVCFADRIQLNQDKLVEGKVVIIEGQIKVDDFGTQIIVRNMMDIEQIAKSEKPKAVWVKSNDIARVQALFDYVKENKGTIPVYVLFNGKKYKSNTDFALSFATFSKLQNMFGQNVKVTYH